MWHRRRRRRLGVTTPHRKALLRNLVRGLAMSRRIETTHARAKETSRFADELVTIAKGGDLTARRHLIRRLGSSEVARIFMDEIAPRLQDRKGGYTRVLKMGIRPGDGGQKSLVEFSIPIEIPAKGKEAKKTKKSKPVKTKETVKEARKPEKKEPKIEKGKPPAPAAEKEETQKRGGFLSKLRKFLTGEEEK